MCSRLLLASAFLAMTLQSNGCRQNNAGPVNRDNVPKEFRRIHELLRSSEQHRFCEGFLQAFEAGHAIVPHLLQWAEDDSPVCWSPPIYLNSGSLIFADVRVRTVCLYLLEAVRRRQLAHSSAPRVVCPESDVDPCERAAIEEYSRWWASVKHGVQPLYVPKVTWDLFPLAAGLASREPVYLPSSNHPQIKHLMAQVKEIVRGLEDP